VAWLSVDKLGFALDSILVVEREGWCNSLDSDAGRGFEGQKKALMI
jgi:hypothetical protein